MTILTIVAAANNSKNHVLEGIELHVKQDSGPYCIDFIRPHGILWFFIFTKAKEVLEARSMKRIFRYSGSYSVFEGNCHFMMAVRGSGFQEF